MKDKSRGDRNVCGVCKQAAPTIFLSNYPGVTWVCSKECADILVAADLLRSLGEEGTSITERLNSTIRHYMEMNAKKPERVYVLPELYYHLLQEMHNNIAVVRSIRLITGPRGEELGVEHGGIPVLPIFTKLILPGRFVPHPSIASREIHLLYEEMESGAKS